MKSISWRAFLNRKTATDAIALTAAQGITLVSGLIALLIYGIIFSKVEIAILGLFQMVVQLAFSLGFTWSALGVIRFGKNELHERETLNETSTIRLIIIAPILITAGLVIFAFRSELQTYLGSDDQTLLIFLFAYLTLLVLDEHTRYLLVTAERHTVNVAIQIARSLANLAVLFLFYAGFLEISAEFYIKLQVLLECVLLTSKAFFLKRAYLLPLRGVNRNVVQQYLLYVLPQIFGFIGIYVINWIDIYFIRTYRTIDELGAYQFLYTIFGQGASIAILINTLFFPRIMHWKHHAPKALKTYLYHAPWTVFWLAIAGCVGALLIYEPIFGLFFDDKYQAAYPAFELLLLTLPLCFLTYVVVPVLNAHDRVFFIQMTNIAAASGNFLIDLLLVPSMGLLGAGIGTFVAFALKAALVVLGSSRSGSINLSPTILGFVLLAGLVSWLSFQPFS